MRSLAIALSVVFVFGQAQTADLESSVDYLRRFEMSEALVAPDPDENDRRRIWGFIKETVSSVADGVVDIGHAVYEGTTNIGATVVNGVVDLGQDILEFTIDLIGPDGFSEKLAREWLDIRIGGNTRVQDVLKLGINKVSSYKNAQCSTLKSAVLPVLRNKIKGQSDGVLYAGYGSDGGFVYGRGTSQGVFVDHLGFEGCYETECEFHGIHAGGGIGVEAGYLHGEGTNDMPGDATGGGVSFDVGPGLDVVGGFTSGGKGFVEIGTGKGLGFNLGSYYTCNTRTYSTNKNTCSVTLYQHDHFKGQRKTYGTGSVPLVWWNDEVSSIKVSGSGCKATVYEHGNYEGWSVTLYSGSYNLKKLRSKGFKNDHMSSMKVKRTRRRTEKLLADHFAGLN